MVASEFCPATMQDAAGPRQLPPLTTRSNSSNVETPRTGGGYTARSSGERGTPRDPQRLALGERPRDDIPRPEGWVGPSLLSPQLTARSSAAVSSAAVSSEPWSMTASSQGDGPSSSDLHYGGEESANTAYQPSELQPRHQSYLANQDDHMDLQKSLEVMRFVIVKENQKLKDLLRSAHGKISEINKQLEQCPPERDQYLAPARESSYVEWRIQKLGEVSALPLCPCGGETYQFSLTDFLGVDFTARFFQWKSDVAEPLSESLPLQAPSRSCEVVLEVGGACDNLDLSIALAMRWELGDDGHEVEKAKSEQRADEESHETRAEHATSVVLHGGGRVSCTGTWSGVVAAVICCIEVEELNWGAGTLCLEGVWPASAQ